MWLWCVIARHNVGHLSFMHATELRLGLRENLGQFSLLLLVNAFVGAMVGLERSILPAVAEQEFHVAAQSAILSFIVVFGIAKASTNYVAGRCADSFCRKQVLVAGWLVAVPVPLVLMWANSWSWIVAANVLLGVSQGLTWSTTVIMKIDLVGPKQRGLAMGLNEFSGYLAVAASALATGWIASRYGLRPQPFYLGVGYVVAGGLCGFNRSMQHTDRCVSSRSVADEVPHTNLLHGRAEGLDVGAMEARLDAAPDRSLVQSSPHVGTGDPLPHGRHSAADTSSLPNSAHTD